MTGFDILHAVNEARAPAQCADVYIEVGVLPAQLAPVRVVAADLAARLDFDLDAVSDLRMAVDEGCATLAILASPEARLRCTLQGDTDRITVTARIPATEAVAIPQDTFGWRVLATLSDEVEVLDEVDESPSSLGIRLVKYRDMA
ncbi:MAG TPA: ATP-binding protein [Pseudonocardiaceae bacterium]|nr:ATP-binding protein [Pseudonocardiaceae bacterium]